MRDRGNNNKLAVHKVRRLANECLQGYETIKAANMSTLMLELKQQPMDGTLADMMRDKGDTDLGRKAHMSKDGRDIVLEVDVRQVRKKVKAKVA